MRFPFSISSAYSRCCSEGDYMAVSCTDIPDMTIGWRRKRNGEKEEDGLAGPQQRQTAHLSLGGETEPKVIDCQSLENANGAI